MRGRGKEALREATLALSIPFSFPLLFFFFISHFLLMFWKDSSERWGQHNRGKSVQESRQRRSRSAPRTIRT